MMMGQFPNMGGGMQQGGQGGRTMDTAAMRRFRQMRENMTPAQRDSLRKRFSRSGNQQGGTRQGNQQNQEGRRNQQNQQTPQTQQTQQTTINR
jgi:hypothetical protein